MKKFIITSILSSLVCVASFGQSLARTILSHEGVLTTYNVDRWTDAITDAEAGDTIFFTKGYFPGDCTITKDITLIGAGEVIVQTGTDPTSGDPVTETRRTTIGGTIYIDLEGEPTLSSWMLQGLHINDNIYLSKPVKGLKIKRCYVEDEFKSTSIDTKCTDVLIESCYFNIIHCGFLVNPYIYNCRIGTIDAENKTFAFENCSIARIEYSTGCTFRNCILYEQYQSDLNSFYYCVYRTDYSGTGSEYTNCYNKPDYSFGGDLTIEELSSAGYFQDDGTTVVGHLGGIAPYTMLPAQPYVSASSVTYSATNNKLNVNITVKKGK